MSFPRVTSAVFVIACACPAAAHADVGIGMRLAWIRPPAEQQADASRYIGGQLRARLSPRTGIELSLDSRTDENDAKTLRTRNRPFQGTLLLNLTSGSFAPYLLGGVGWYQDKVETLDASGKVTGSTSETTFGYHAGFGAEIRAGQHAGIHADYRYKFIRDPDSTSDGGPPIIGTIADKLGLSRSGSMWTAGVTVYF